MAKIKIDQSSLIRREVETDHNKRMEALKDEYRANLYCGPQTGSVADHHQGWEDWRVREQQDRAAVAEVRGKQAARRMKGQEFLEKKAQLAARETKEGAKLVERLRAAEIVSRPRQRRQVEIVDVVCGEQRKSQPMNVGSGGKVKVQQRKNTRYVPLVERIPLGDLASVNNVEGNHTSSLGQQPKVIEKRKEAEETVEPVFRREYLGQEFTRMMQELDNVDHTGLSDSSLSLLSSLSPAYLSTILEATETDGGGVIEAIEDDDDTTAQSIALDDVDHEPVRGPSSAEDSANKSAAELSSDASTDFKARISRRRREDEDVEDLDSVRKLLDRIKDQRKILDERNEMMSEGTSSSAQGEATHFKTIEGAAQGGGYKNVNRDFVNKVLDFENSSVLVNSRQKPRVNSWTEDSSTFSSNEPARKKEKKVRKKKKQVATEPVQSQVNKDHNKDKQSENNADTKQSELRGYIEKLLSMKHEDVANLSVSTLSSNKDSIVSNLTSSLKSSSTPYSNSHSSDSSGKKQVRFRFDTTQDDSSYLGLPIKNSKMHSTQDDSSYLGLPVKNSRKNSNTSKDMSLPVKNAEIKDSHLNETTTSVDTIYKQLNLHPGGAGLQTNLSPNIPDNSYPEIRPQNFAAVQSFPPSSKDEENLIRSQKEIQSLFRQKRQQLNDQLRKLELEDNSDIETLSEGPLSSSHGSTSSFEMLSSILDRGGIKELSSIVDTKRMEEQIKMPLSDVSSLRGAGSDDTQTHKHQIRGLRNEKDRSKELSEISLGSRRDTYGHLQDENRFTFNLSDDNGDTGDESTKSKISHIDLSSDEE